MPLPRHWRPARLRASGVADPAFGWEHLCGLSLSVPLTDMFGWLLGIVTPQQQQQPGSLSNHAFFFAPSLKSYLLACRAKVSIFDGLRPLARASGAPERRASSRHASRGQVPRPSSGAGCHIQERSGFGGGGRGVTASSPSPCAMEISRHAPLSARPTRRNLAGGVLRLF